jgi:hypothetical protein
MGGRSTALEIAFLTVAGGEQSPRAVGESMLGSGDGNCAATPRLKLAGT